MDHENDLLKSVWPEWRIVRRIGRGSFGSVYEVVRGTGDLTSRAAVKIIEIPSDPAAVDALRSEGMDDEGTRTYLEGVVRDFVGEIRVMNSLKGAPNVVSIEDYRLIKRTDTFGWFILIRMELLTPFTNVMSKGPLSEEQVLTLGRDICSALTVCGELNILHRDIKPQNVFVDRFGSYKLGDFGIARKIEQTASALSHKGTYNYMAPEVSRQEPYDNRADICSLGVMLYQLMNENRLPFIENASQLTDPNGRLQALSRRLSGNPMPPPCRASKEFARIILRACAFRPEDRYPDAKTFKTDLERLLFARSSAAEAPGTAAIPTARSEAGAKPAPAAKPEAGVMSAPDAKSATGAKPEAGAKSAPDAKPETGAKPTPDAKSGAGAKPGAPSQGEGEKKKRRVPVILIAALALVLCGAIAAVLFTTVFAGVDVPGLVGQTKEAAIAALSEKGLAAASQTRYDDAPEGTVVAQSPEQGAKVKKNTEVVLTVSLGPDSATGITVSTLPSKTSYFIGESLDTAGLTLTEHHRSGGEEEIRDGFLCEPEVLDRHGTQNVTVTYDGMTAAFEVTVERVVLTELLIRDQPAKTSYFVGESFDKTGLTLFAAYSDGSTKVVESGFSCPAEYFGEAGMKTITVSYGGMSVDLNVNVEAVTLTKIEIKKEPNKTEYFAGETLNDSGIALTAYYSDGSSKTVTKDILCSPTALGTAGTKAIKVSYGGLETSFNVTVLKAALTGIEVVAVPVKTEYFVGDRLDAEGLAVTASYTDGSRKTVTGDCELTDTSFDTPGERTVSVTYQDKHASFSVTVKSVEVRSIRIASKPLKTVYDAGDRLAEDGLTLLVTYSNDTVKTVSDGFFCNPDRFNYAGTHTVSVSYGGITESFSVEVLDNLGHTPGSPNLLSGTVIGNMLGWGGDPAAGAAAAFDGDPNTYFDPPEKGGDNWCGMDFGRKVVLEKVAILSRVDWNDRFVGATIDGSNDGKNWTTLWRSFDMGVNPLYYVVTEFENNTGYSMYRYHNEAEHGDVAEIEFYSADASSVNPPSGSTAALLRGTVIGNKLGWSDDPAVGAAAAFDGDPSTYFDPPDKGGDNWCGMDFGRKVVLAKVAILSRADWNDRFVGATIDGSNDGKNWTTLWQSSETGTNPFYYVVTEFQNNTGYSMYRYHNETEHGDVADIEFYGY
ncbi:MAG: bacterial Ig-like domain-containing protein [Clostridia bacterium]|nr:bacterial Ig-like domain-containing protein [Clostridia bacterium]